MSHPPGSVSAFLPTDSFQRRFFRYISFGPLREVIRTRRARFDSDTFPPLVTFEFYSGFFSAGNKGGWRVNELPIIFFLGAGTLCRIGLFVLVCLRMDSVGLILSLEGELGKKLFLSLYLLNCKITGI